jgi:hypothetical protein
MEILPVKFATVTDLTLQDLSKRGAMTVEEAAEMLGCSTAEVADFLLKLVKSTKDPYRYMISQGETWTEPGRTPLPTVQVLVESRRRTALRRRMTRRPEFQQVGRLRPFVMFTLGQAARALKMPRRKTARLLGRYRKMGYLRSFRLVSRRGPAKARWQRIW